MITRSDLVQSCKNSKASVVYVVPDFLAARTLSQILFRTILAGEKTACQRVVINHSQVLSYTNWCQRLFVFGAVIEVIERLQALISGNPGLIANLQGFQEALGAIV